MRHSEALEKIAKTLEDVTKNCKLDSLTQSLVHTIWEFTQVALNRPLPKNNCTETEIPKEFQDDSFTKESAKTIKKMEEEI